MNNMNESPGTAPQSVGTFYLQAHDNEDIHYSFGCVELYEAPGTITFKLQKYVLHEDGDYYVKFWYKYEGGYPESGAKLKTYFLKPFVPVKDEQGNLIDPSYFYVFNKDNPHEHKTGKINKNNPPILPWMPNQPHEKLYHPRAMVLRNIPGNFAELEAPGTVPETGFIDYFIFVIAKTRNPDNKYLTLEGHGDVVKCTADTSEHGPHGEYYGAVGMIDSDEEGQYNSVELMDYHWTLDYSSYYEFYYENYSVFISEGEGSL